MVGRNIISSPYLHGNIQSQGQTSWLIFNTMGTQPLSENQPRRSESKCQNDYWPFMSIFCGRELWINQPTPRLFPWDSPESVAYWPFLTRPGISCHSSTSGGAPLGQAIPPNRVNQLSADVSWWGDATDFKLKLYIGWLHSSSVLKTQVGKRKGQRIHCSKCHQTTK